LNDQEFIEKLIRGDQNAYNLLVEQYAQRVYNSVLGFVQNKEDAEEVTQDVFTEVFLSVIHFKSNSRLSTWIYRIAVTKSLDFLRQKNRKKRYAVFLDVFVKEGNASFYEPLNFNHPGVQMQNKEQASILFAAIDKLPEKQKTAFVLNKVEGLSYSQIADIMSVSLSSVESLLFRAKQNLQKLLGNYYENNLN
jgi:RNA polymerase sigma-70 factor (ECF subfamily)